MKPDKKRYCKGLTLIELVIVIAVISIFTLGAFAFFSHNVNTYYKGMDQVNVQDNIRLVNDYLTDQVRFAADVTILTQTDIDAITDPSNTVEAFVNYVYFKDGVVYIVSRETIDNPDTQISYYIGEGGGLLFSSVQSTETAYSDTILAFTVTGQEQNQVYSIDSEVKPLNLGFRNAKIDATGSGPAIAFRTTGNIESVETQPEVVLVDPIDTDTIEVTFGMDLAAATKIFDNDLSSGSTVVLTTLRVVTVETGDAGVDGRRIVFEVQDTALDLYSYALTFDGTSWGIAK